ncbi:MAG: hypothetical protein LBT83_10035, partial [Tannerella sp.]|nr:hypothetical protein [Tannerella sp.]
IDPLFASPLAPGLNTGGDYSLQVSSPAIGAGNNPDYTGGLPALATATDLAGNPRLFGCKHRHGGV